MTTAATVIKRSDLKQMFTDMGCENVEKWSLEKLEKNMKKAANWVANGQANEPESNQSKELLDLIVENLTSDDGLIQIEDDEPDVDTSEDGELEEPPVGEEKGEDKPKRGRGRPKGSGAKSKVEKVPEEPLAPPMVHSFNFRELEKPKLVKLTEKLAKEIRDTKRYPNDRDLQTGRVEYLRKAIENGEFRGCPEWVVATVESESETYRLNGKHTSTVFSELFEAGQKPDFQILIRKYVCPTMEDAAGLFSTFDARQSSRSKNDIIKGFAATKTGMVSLPSKTLSVLVSGLAFARWETTYRRQGPVDQSLLLLQNEEFAAWVAPMFDGTADEVKHIRRMSVVAAMYKTWICDKEKADDFWDGVRNDSNEPVGHPVRMLYKYLREKKVGAVKKASESISERQCYLACLKAWNHWRKDEGMVTKDFGYKDTDKTPEVI